MARNATSTKPRNDAPPPSEAREVAVIQPPRLPFHPAVQERFGIDRSQWKALVEAVFPNARTPDGVILALSYCKARRLDPFKRQVHIVPIYDSKKRAEVETVWPGIAEHRTTATRTGTYAGMDAPEYGPSITKTFKGRAKAGYGQDAEWKDEEVEVTFPEWCRVTVYRMVQGVRVPFPGPRVMWLEYYNKKGRASDVPNEQWGRRPFYMIEKCAEAGALRRAFPEELGDEFTVEEVGFFGNNPSAARPVEAEVVGTTTPTREPQRSDFTEGEGGDAGGEPEVEHDPATGEVTDTKKAEPEAEPTEAAANPWYPEAVGQEAVAAAIIELIKTRATTTADLDAIVAANADRVKKFTQANRAAINNALDDRREDLGAGGAE